MMMNPTKYHTTLDAIHLGIHTWTGKKGRPLIALHGFMGDGLDFESLATHLSRPIIAPDLPYHGSSKAMDAAPWSMQRTVQMLAGWLEDVESFDLLGYSMGGRVALSLAANAQHLNIRNLILIGATPGLKTQHEKQQRIAQDHQLATQFEQMNMPNILEMWRQKPIIQSQNHIPQPWLNQLNARRQFNKPERLAASLRHMGTGQMPSIWPLLSIIDASTLLMTGQRDKKFESIAINMMSSMPKVTHQIVSDAGHSCHLEQPVLVAHQISSHLSVHDTA